MPLTPAPVLASDDGARSRSNAAAAAAAAPASSPRGRALAALTLGAIGVVYGDIGTSPLYTMQEIFAPRTGVPLDATHLIGAASVILWALMLVVTLKYVLLILRADNHGEGGGLALTALAIAAVAGRPRLRRVLLLLGVAGATLFYGDSVITPAISVLGAVEGLKVLAPGLEPFVVPIALVILVGLFAVQRRGTAAVGRWFGPVIVLWFVVLGGTGIVQIVQQPGILAALDPREAVAFLQGRGAHLLVTVGAIVLAVTGAEALYADMGHFGARPIRIAWTGLVLPCLALNYLGQGALLMGNPAAIESPFYRMFPSSWLIPALLLATLAAIIASQAVISGAYSMTRQAIQLGFLPRMTVRNTSAREAGQIYMPTVNWALLVGVLAAVVGFGSSSAIASAYGIAVTLTMLITTVLTFFVVRDGWRLPTPIAAGATGLFLSLDALLVAGCAIKFADGGWFPLALGGVLFIGMTTWARGRGLLLARVHQDGLALEPFVQSLSTESLPRARRTAVYAVADPTTVPQALLHNLKHNQVLHQRNIVLTVQFAQTPFVADGDRLQVERLSADFVRATLNFGFFERPDVPRALQRHAPPEWALSPFETTYFLSRNTVVPTPGEGMAGWRERLFATMSRNASGVAAYFHLPDNAVVELGTRVQI